MTGINISLLRKTLEFAEAHPEETDLHWWVKRTGCGTTACIAGRAVIFADHETVNGLLTADGRFIEEVATEELGLTELQATQLFYCDSLDEVWEAAERITDGEIRRSP